MNRKAEVGNQIMIFPFLFLIIVIAGGIVAGTVMFFGDEYDFRTTDAELLNYNIKKCIMDSNIDWNDENTFYEKCSINKTSLQKNELKFKICKNSENCVLEESAVLRYFGSNFIACDFEGIKNNKNFPKCVVSAFEINGDKYQIVSGSNQWNKKRNLGL